MSKIYLLTVTEMVVIKNLFIFKYYRIATINEYFLTAVVTHFNIVFVFGTMSSHIILKTYEDSIYYSSHFNPLHYVKKTTLL